MLLARENGEPIEESAEASEAFFKREEFIHFICMLNPPRPGIRECIQLLEHTHYAMGTPANSHLWFRVLLWEDLTWGIVSIPFTDREYMESVAALCGLRISNSIPVMVNAKGMAPFPIHDLRTFMLSPNVRVEDV